MSCSAVVHFAVSDVATGDTRFTTVATVKLDALVGRGKLVEDEGALVEIPIVGYAITETDDEPDSWFGEAPATYTIQEDVGTTGSMIRTCRRGSIGFNISYLVGTGYRGASVPSNPSGANCLHYSQHS